MQNIISILNYGSVTLGSVITCLFMIIIGGTLADYIQKRCNSLLDEDTILHFFVQILLALYHVHNKLILHRDLKTQNILLDKHQMIVKIGDFGISKILVSKSKAYTVSTNIVCTVLGNDLSLTAVTVQILLLMTGCGDTVLYLSRTL